MSLLHLFQIGRDFSREVVHGVAGIVKTMWHGVERVAIDIDVFQLRRWGENWRDQWYVVEDSGIAVYRLFRLRQTGPFVELVGLILKEYNSLFPRQVLYDEMDITAKIAGFTYGRYMLGRIIAKSTAEQISKQVMVYLGSVKAAEAASLKIPFIGIVVTVLSVEGFMDKAIKSKNRLKATFPQLYLQLRSRHLEMLYFLVEKPMQKYLNTIRLARLFPLQFKQELLQTAPEIKL